MSAVGIWLRKVEKPKKYGCLTDKVCYREAYTHLVGTILSWPLLKAMSDPGVPVGNG